MEGQFQQIPGHDQSGRKIIGNFATDFNTTLNRSCDVVRLVVVVVVAGHLALSVCISFSQIIDVLYALCGGIHTIHLTRPVSILYKPPPISVAKNCPVYVDAGGERRRRSPTQGDRVYDVVA